MFSQEGIIFTVIVPKSGGVTSTHAVVVRWLKHEGDAIRAGDPLVELETEKVSYELESPATGVLSRVIAHESAEVPVGDPLCDIEEASNPTTQTGSKGVSNAKARKSKVSEAKK